MPNEHYDQGARMKSVALHPNESNEMRIAVTESFKMNYFKYEFLLIVIIESKL